ncbi:MAG: AAA family ATPase, partial [Rhizobiaceae bacterium]|nr:AAA family ATPase [Rhizobiaceae bacterium]
MLVQLVIQNIVLIDRLQIEFNSSLTVLTGETGAGKSILLDALSLALGARGDGDLVRQGSSDGQVMALFSLPAEHGVLKYLSECDVLTRENTADSGDFVDIILRRT